MDAIPTNIGRYVVEGLVGVGAMGRIYKARDPDIRRTVAIKLISTKLMSSADRADYVRRFRREDDSLGCQQRRRAPPLYGQRQWNLRGSLLIRWHSNRIRQIRRHGGDDRQSAVIPHELEKLLDSCSSVR